MISSFSSCPIPSSKASPTRRIGASRRQRRDEQIVHSGNCARGRRRGQLGKVPRINFQRQASTSKLCTFIANCDPPSSNPHTFFLIAHYCVIEHYVIAHYVIVQADFSQPWSQRDLASKGRKPVVTPQQAPAQAIKYSHVFFLTLALSSLMSLLPG